jgi:hypothetical protein
MPVVPHVCVAADRALDCRIHFRLGDGESRREHSDAFAYAWRLWSIDELIDGCARAGFSSAQLWRHTYDASKGAGGLFLGPVAPSAVAQLRQWTAYLVAAR